MKFYPKTKRTDKPLALGIEAGTKRSAVKRKARRRRRAQRSKPAPERPKHQKK